MAGSYKTKLGAAGETIALKALSSRGYALVEQNWRCRRGEVDLVMRDGDCWAFVEVKTRRARGIEPPEAALTATKAQRLVNLAQTYLAVHEMGLVDWRIDLVAIELDAHGAVHRLDVYQGVALP